MKLVYFSEKLIWNAYTKAKDRCTDERYSITDAQI